VSAEQPVKNVQLHLLAAHSSCAGMTALLRQQCPGAPTALCGVGRILRQGAPLRMGKLTVPDIGFWRLLIVCYEGISLSSLLSCTHKSDAYEKKDEFQRISRKVAISS
jgi:hypothetical protein